MPIPRVKTKTTSVQSPRSLCGDNWDKNVKIQNPYRGVDLHFRNMLSLADAPLVTARDDELPAQLELERKRVGKLVVDRSAALSPSQRSHIAQFLERARDYLQDAAKIQKFWSVGFATAKFGAVPATPISIQAPQGTRYEVIRGHDKDAAKWSALITAALKNIRCAEEIVRKTEVLKLNKAAWEKNHG